MLISDIFSHMPTKTDNEKHWYINMLEFFFLGFNCICTCSFLFWHCSSQIPWRGKCAKHYGWFTLSKEISMGTVNCKF